MSRLGLFLSSPGLLLCNPIVQAFFIQTWALFVQPRDSYVHLGTPSIHPGVSSDQPELLPCRPGLDLCNPRQVLSTPDFLLSSLWLLSFTLRVLPSSQLLLLSRLGPSTVPRSASPVQPEVISMQPWASATQPRASFNLMLHTRNTQLG